MGHDSLASHPLFALQMPYKQRIAVRQPWISRLCLRNKRLQILQSNKTFLANHRLHNPSPFIIWRALWISRNGVFCVFLMKPERI